MKDKDYIKELFSEKLSSHEVPVRSDLWSGIQSQLGNTAATTVAAKGVSIAAKWAIGIASSVIVAGSVVWFTADGDVEQKTQVQLSNTELEANKAETSSDVTEAKSTDSGVEIVVDKGSETPSNERNSVNKRVESKSVNENVSDYTPLIVLPAVVKPVESKTAVDEKTSVDNKTTPIDNKKVDSKTNNESTKTVPEQTKVIGQVAPWRKTNVFSPNGDGKHDYFHLETKNLKEFQITIYNNSNKKTVFTSNDPDFKWYAEDVPDGSYGYVVIAIDENGNRIAMANELTILR